MSIFLNRCETNGDDDEYVSGKRRPATRVGQGSPSRAGDAIAQKIPTCKRGRRVDLFGSKSNLNETARIMSTTHPATTSVHRCRAIRVTYFCTRTEEPVLFFYSFRIITRLYYITLASGLTNRNLGDPKSLNDRRISE